MCKSSRGSKSMWWSQLTELREASQRITSMRTETFWPPMMAARMKNGERQMPVGGMLVPFQVWGVFSIMKWA